MPWVLYILLCDQKTYYVGITSNLPQRLKSHRAKYNPATKRFSDIQLIYTEQYKTRTEIEIREKQIKDWSIAKKKALVEGKYSQLKRLSKTRS